MQENLLEQISFAFTHPPLLFGGKALERHRLRKGNDIDWILSAADFQTMHQTFPEGYFTNAYGDEGIRWGQHEFYRSCFGNTYPLVIAQAQQCHQYLVASPLVLLYLKIATVMHEMNNQKAWRDIRLLTKHLCSRFDDPDEDLANSALDQPSSEKKGEQA